VGIDGMAHAPVWLQEVISRNNPVFLLALFLFWRERIAKLAEGLSPYMG
jgi:hypothetical protein